LKCGAPDDRADRVVVCDGGSRDRTRELACEGGAELVTSARGRGVQLRAAALALATDVLVFLHADTCPAPGALREIRRRFEDPSVRAAGLRQVIEARGLFYRCVERAADLRVRLFGLVYGDSGLCVRRDDYHAVGGFRELALFEDVDLSRRLRGERRARWIGSAPLYVSARRWRSEGVLRATLRNWMLIAAYSAGVDPRRLASFYAPNSNPS
jgi:cellulose synthase/poly-beta-1,6-N-acetylglucosamine synthase-like glycosyltransferase